MRRALVAVVGAGPSGFYTSKYLLNKPGTAVHLIETLPCPFGLVRFGVAPDHPEVKTVVQDFTKIAEHPNLRFFGNCHVGKDVSVAELLSMYDAVVLAVGADGENTLGLPGEDRLVQGARDLVAWYNGHPKLDASLSSALSNAVSHARNVVVFGNGNVALDCARILVSPLDQLRTTDISQRALDALAVSRIERVTILGRRSSVHAAFTIKEVRELTKLPGVSLEIDGKELALSPPEAEQVENNRARKRLHALLVEAAAAGSKSQASKVISLRFCLAPCELVAADGNSSNVLTGVVAAKTAMKGSRAEPTGETETFKCDLALRAIGYRGQQFDADIALDSSRGVVPTQQGGRVVGKDRLYATGWIKRGATGILGTNIPDARETADAVLEDLDNRKSDSTSSGNELSGLLQSRGVAAVDWKGWQAIDQVESSRGQALGKPRVKMDSVADMLAAIEGHR